jgi:hypothetical protein
MRRSTSGTASNDYSVDEIDEAGYTAAAKCLADDLDALVVHLRYPCATAAGGDRRTCSSAPSAR